MVYDDERIDEEKVKCIECVKIVLVILINNLEFGDYIVFRNVNYDYYGIIIFIKGSGFFEIIEVINIFVGVLFGVSSFLFLIFVKSKVNI